MIVLLFALSCLLTQGTTITGQELSGDWILTEQFPDETQTHRMNLAVTGDKITGTSAGVQVGWLNFGVGVYAQLVCAATASRWVRPTRGGLRLARFTAKASGRE